MTQEVTTTVSATGAGMLTEASVGDTLIGGLALYAVIEIVKWLRPKVVKLIKKKK